MGISQDEVEREKRRLPRGWGRFGKSLEHIAELSEPGEALLSSCVGLNPEFRRRGAARQQLPEFLDVVAGQARPADPATDDAAQPR